MKSFILITSKTGDAPQMDTLSQKIVVNCDFKLELSLKAIHTPTIVHYKAEARVRCVVEKTWALHIP